MRFQYAKRMKNHDWELVSWSDEAWFDTSEIHKLLTGKLLFYTTPDGKNIIPEVWNTKWSGCRVAFTVICDATGYKHILTWEKISYQPPPVDPKPIIADYASDSSSYDSDASMVGEDTVFEKRGWKITYNKRKKKERPKPSMDSVNFIELVAPEIEIWWDLKTIELEERFGKRVAAEKEKYMWHIFDNARYHTSKMTQEYMDKYTNVRIYPSGGIHGVKGGFPPYSPDFNFVAECLIGTVKRMTAEWIAVNYDAMRRKNLSVFAVSQIMKEQFSRIQESEVTRYVHHMRTCINEAVATKGKYGPTFKKCAKPASSD